MQRDATFGAGLPFPGIPCLGRASAMRCGWRAASWICALPGLALLPAAGWTLELAQSPPGTKQPYVAPNVIVSIDDSASLADPGGISMEALARALRQAFGDPELLPDAKIRLSWQAMANHGKPPESGNVDAGGPQPNAMRVLDMAHRNRFLAFVAGLAPAGTADAHRALGQADAYLRRPPGPDGPWAALPGSQGEPYLACRRSYHLVMSGGRWSGPPSGGQQDGAAPLTLPDGSVFGATAQTRLYRDAYSDTLADWAFKSWAIALQPGLYSATDPARQIPPAAEYRKAPPAQPLGGLALQKYWSPQYDPANWPHMATYTVGLGAAAAAWPGAPSIIAPTQMLPLGHDGSFPDLVDGTQSWPDVAAGGRHALDLWHAALNGRGRFFAVRQAEELAPALRSILGRIEAEAEPARSAGAANGSSTVHNEVQLFTAHYAPLAAWKGWITSETLQSDGSRAATAGWQGKSTADRLDDASLDPQQRLILSWSERHGRGIPLRWAEDESLLSAAQKAHFHRRVDGSSDGLGPQRLAYLRGDRSLEGSEPADYTPARPFRARQSRQADIVNSRIWYQGPPVGRHALKGHADFVRSYRARPPMIYVGGNDGMLHGFSAADGREKIAYVPQGVLPALARLADPDYDDRHRYFVDGSPMAGDADLGTAGAPRWRTVLVGTPGAGAKGYFVLDVTHPAGDFSDDKAGQLVLLDTSRHALDPLPDCGTLAAARERRQCEEAADIGHILAPPVLDDADPARATQIARLNDRRWAVVLGNGYNSKNQRPVLLIQYLDGGRELLRLAAGATPGATDNGLAAPRLVDINGDGRPDVAYAGDNQGNLWKFDIASPDPGDWGVALGGAPLFTALGPPPGAGGGAARTERQPISSAPTVRASDRMQTIRDAAGRELNAPVVGMMVAFGTGRASARTDPESTAVQTLYAVLDGTRYELVGSGSEQHVKVASPPMPLGAGPAPARLARRQVGPRQAGAAGGDFWSVDSAAGTATPAVDWSSQNGWYLDLPEPGERLLQTMRFYDGSNILAAFTEIPARSLDSTPGCMPAPVQAQRNYLTLLNIMDGRRATVPLMDLNGDGLYNAQDQGASRTRVAQDAQILATRDRHSTGLSAAGSQTGLARMPEQALRPSWHQLK